MTKQLNFKHFSLAQVNKMVPSNAIKHKSCTTASAPSEPVSDGSPQGCDTGAWAELNIVFSFLGGF